ncbi:MAG: hypothetical protein ACLVI9_01765 [Anaerostipes hadrus]
MFQNDLKIKISTGSSRRSKTWLKQEMYWSDFVEKLEHPIRTEETLAEYMGYCKAKQDEIKDVGGFVGGELSGEQRRNENAGYRYLITLDADHIKPGGTDEVISILENLCCSYVIYSTRKHEEQHPDFESFCHWISRFLQMNMSRSQDVLQSISEWVSLTQQHSKQSG